MLSVGPTGDSLIGIELAAASGRLIRGRHLRNGFQHSPRNYSPSHLLMLSNGNMWWQLFEMLQRDRWEMELYLRGAWRGGAHESNPIQVRILLNAWWRETVGRSGSAFWSFSPGGSREKRDCGVYVR